MIDYRPGRWHIGFAFRWHGSVLPKALLWGVPSGLLALGLKLYLNHLEISFENFAVSQAWASYNAMLAFLVVFRTTNAYGRYWEGATNLRQVRGEWFGATSSLFAFCSRDPSKQEDVLKFQHRLVRLMSMLWVTALEQLADKDLGFDVADISGFAPESIAWVRQQDDKCEVILQWIQNTVIRHIDSQVLDVPPPIITRVFQELSRGRVGLEQVQTIIDVRFPFPYAQMMAFALVANTFILPVLCAEVIDSAGWCFGITVVSVTALWGVNYTAAELENPFEDDYNDLPLPDYCKSMNTSLERLLDQTCTQSPEFCISEADMNKRRVKYSPWSAANYAAKRQAVANSSKRLARNAIAVRARYMRSRLVKSRSTTSTQHTECEATLDMDEVGHSRSNLARSMTNLESELPTPYCEVIGVAEWEGNKGASGSEEKLPTLEEEVATEVPEDKDTSQAALLDEHVTEPKPKKITKKSVRKKEPEPQLSTA